MGTKLKIAPGLPTTASSVAQQGACENCAIAEHSENKSRKRGGGRVKRQQEVWKGRRSLVRVDAFNIGTMTGRGRELADLMKRRNVNILCLQETKWKGSKAKNIGGGWLDAKYFTAELMEEKLG